MQLVGVTYLCVTRVGIEHIGEEFTRTGHARDDQSVDIKAIDDKEMGEALVFWLGVKGRGDGGVGTLRILRGHARRRGWRSY